MVNVNVEISGIVQNCDESLLSIQFGNGYSLEKIYFDELTFQGKIVDGYGRIDVQYSNSRMYDNEKLYFICLKKHDNFQILGLQLPKSDKKQISISEDDLMCKDQLKPYQNQENAFIHKQFSLLRVFKEGNLGMYDVFFKYDYKIWMANNTFNCNSANKSRNCIDNRIYSLSNDEITACQDFLEEYSGDVYSLLQNPINEFIWGLEQIDIATGFEQYTTALEILLLESNQPGKKQKLAKRVALLIGNNPNKIVALHRKMMDFYRFRSDSLHEGDSSNITLLELHELESIIRSVLIATMKRCKTELLADPSLNWDDIKKKQIDDLRIEVTTAVTNGVLPA